MDHQGQVMAEMRRLRRARQLELVLDYDGTLVPFAPCPELAAPDEDLIDLLTQLAVRPGTKVHLLTGRNPRCLEEWFGKLSLTLHAEDGYWSRLTPGGAWVTSQLGALRWKQPVEEILADLTRRTGGSVLEKKTASLAWHYRMVEPFVARFRLQEARLRLNALRGCGSFEILSGPKVLEVRKMGITKSRVVSQLGFTCCPLLAAGDDSADEQLFLALPEDATLIHVGFGPTHAGYRVPSPAALRRALRVLLGPASRG